MKRALPLLAAALGLATPARAQSNAALAETLYQEGKRLMGEQRYAEGCPKLAESHKLDPATGTLLNLAACYEGWGKYATAWAHYNDAVTAAQREGQDYRVKYATDQLTALEGKLTRLQVDVAPEANQPGLEVTVDGRSLPSAAFGVPTPVDPGTHVVEAGAPGKKRVRLTVQADAPGGIVKALVPRLEDAGAQPASTASPSPPEPAARPSPEPTPAPPPAASPAPVETGGGTRTLGFVLGGAGVVLLGAGTAFHFFAASANDDAKALCTQGPNGDECASQDELIDHEDKVDAAKLGRTLSYVGWGVGAAGIAAGVALIVSSSSSESPPATALELTPVLAPRAAGAALSGRF